MIAFAQDFDDKCDLKESIIIHCDLYIDEEREDKSGFGFWLNVDEKEKGLYVFLDYNRKEVSVEAFAKISFCPMCGRKL